MEKYLQEAINEYEQKIESGEPFYMEASTLMDIEEIYEKAGKAYDAERLMRFAEKIHPDNEDVLIVKAYREKDRGHWQEALQIVKSINNQEGRNVQIFYAEKEVSSGQLDKAEQRIEDCLPAVLTEESYDWYLDLGELFLDYGFQERALKYLSRIPKKYQFAERVNELMADAYFQLQDFENSIERANTLVDLNPYNATSWAQMADIQQKNGLFEECAQSCDYALAIDPNNVKGMSLKVFALFAQKRNEEALSACSEYMKKMPNEYCIRMYAGEHLCSLTKYNDSLVLLGEALNLCPIDNPDRMRILTDISYAYIGTGQYDKAEEMLMSTCLLGNTPCDILLQLGNTYMEMGLLHQAFKTYSTLLRNPKVEEKELISMAQSLARTNNVANASELWHKMAIEASTIPNDSILDAYLAWAMFQFREKESMYKHLKKSFPNYVGVIIQLFGGLFNTYNINDILYKINQGIEETNA